MALIQNLSDCLNNVRSKYHRSSYYDESATKQAIIEPLIRRLGWNTCDIDEVYPEYRIDETSEKVDFSLRLDRINKIFIEVKKVSESLEKHEGQLFNYCHKEETELAVLTNGFIWWFYLSEKIDNHLRGKFCEIDILQQDIEVIANKFVELLSKQNVRNGNFLKTAGNIYKKIILTKELKLFIEYDLPDMNIHTDFLADIIRDKKIEVSDLSYPQQKKLLNDFMKKEVLKSDYVIDTFIDKITYEYDDDFEVGNNEVVEIIDELI